MKVEFKWVFPPSDFLLKKVQRRIKVVDSTDSQDKKNKQTKGQSPSFVAKRAKKNNEDLFFESPTHADTNKTDNQNNYSNKTSNNNDKGQK